MASTPPTKPSRVSVPVAPEVHATFQRLADATGRSLGSAMAEWLRDTQGAAQLMAENMERLKRSPGEFLAKVQLHTAGIEEAAEAALEKAMGAAEWGEGVQRKRQRAAGPPAPLTPPSSNTGGKVQRSTKKPNGGRS
jgi:hypothetical protein